MKLVFTRAEVADSLGLTEHAFENMLPLLFVEGFPRPIPGLGESWSIMDVMQWVNRDKPCCMPGSPLMPPLKTNCH